MMRRPACALGADVLADFRDAGLDSRGERRIGAVLEAHRGIDQRARGRAGLSASEAGARDDDHERGHETAHRRHECDSAVRARTDAASQLTPTRAPASNRRRRAGWEGSGSSSVPATSTAYSTFSARYIRLRTTPGTTTSPSVALADSGTSVSDSWRRTRNSRWPGA